MYLFLPRERKFDYDHINVGETVVAEKLRRKAVRNLMGKIN